MERPIIECAEKDCEHFIKSHAWAKIKADRWFFQKNNIAWCPDHIPGWVTSWRKRKETQQSFTQIRR